MPLKRYVPSENDPVEPGTGWPNGEPLLKDFPTLLEFLSCSSWPDGEERRTGTITLSLYEGRCSLCLNDRDQARSCFVSGETIKDVFKAAEKVADGSQGRWRATSWSQGARKKPKRAT